ncbi:hypothetical protein WOLCODRAFT_161243 [Wolfiporia cocos MD-104 SS10]|uniref:rRNA-processing protein FYV7 n=1 Tax=Wolfiporia cocos (strain MD-104) TaxID=742152 RepID=A0A2H3JPT2_WOLCO|nr:hypothetical protein WOLCODRAFT_161243 [Wolfiporia cocos MD-104 SS10]
MVAPSAEPRKRKPPTFRHLPLNRAKKLKRSWVEVQKIKSKWKAQKRKEGIVTKGRQIDELLAEEDKAEEDEAENDSGAPEERAGDLPEHVDGSSREDSGEDDSDEDSIGAVPEERSPPPSKKRKQAHPEKPAEQRPTLRELQKQAYSRSSLHTYKSDPLHRRRGAAPKTGDRHAERGRGNGRGDFSGGRDGDRGQPDMRLRMNAMLEKIKRDFA